MNQTVTYSCTLTQGAVSRDRWHHGYLNGRVSAGPLPRPVTRRFRHGNRCNTIAYIATRVYGAQSWRRGEVLLDFPVVQYSGGLLPWFASIWVRYRGVFVACRNVWLVRRLRICVTSVSSQETSCNSCPGLKLGCTRRRQHNLGGAADVARALAVTRAIPSRALTSRVLWSGAPTSLGLERPQGERSSMRTTTR